ISDDDVSPPFEEVPLDLTNISKDWLDGSRGFCSIECSVHLEQLVCETKRDVFNKDGAQNIMQIHSAMEPKAQKRDGNNEDQNFNIWYCNNPCFCGFDSEDMMDAKQIVKYTDAKSHRKQKESGRMFLTYQNIQKTY
ncbi:6164_t:CDS:2, partial [Entrophospora sp. SA101]